MDVLGTRGSQPHPEWVALSQLEEKRLRELTEFWARYRRGDTRPAAAVRDALTGGEQDSGIVLTDEVLFDLQTLVMTLTDLNAVVVELHLNMYSDMLDDLRALRGYVPLGLFS